MYNTLSYGWPFWSLSSLLRLSLSDRIDYYCFEVKNELEGRGCWLGRRIIVITGQTNVCRAQLKVAGAGCCLGSTSYE